jgi:hypothetical protein
VEGYWITHNIGWMLLTPSSQGDYVRVSDARGWLLLLLLLLNFLAADDEANCYAGESSMLTRTPTRPW